VPDCPTEFDAASRRRAGGGSHSQPLVEVVTQAGSIRLHSGGIGHGCRETNTVFRRTVKSLERVEIELIQKRTRNTTRLGKILTLETLDATVTPGRAREGFTLKPATCL